MVMIDKGKNMRVRYINMLAVSALISSACTDFLNVLPKTSIADDATIIDQQSAETAINGVYASYRSYFDVSYQTIGYLSGDNIEFTGSQSQIKEFIDHNVNAENSTIASAWSGIYVTINRANHVIDKVPALSNDAINATIKDRILGEAYFIRGLAYFDLARVWGGVPLITKPTAGPTDNVGVPRSTQAQAYAQALSDWELAEGLLPQTTDRRRGTQKTVWALKARYYLYHQQWQQAIDHATRLIDDQTNYQLVTPYNAWFANNAAATQEAVFELFHSTNEINGHYASWQPQERGGTRQWAPNNAFAQLVTNPGTGGGRSALVGVDNQGRWYGNLYYRTNGSDPSFVFRVAELYLVRAEAHAKLGRLENALDDLNAVRERAALDPLEGLATEDAVLLAIENERRLEFGLEAHRWFDLVRTGRAQTVLGITNANRLLLPLPAEQVLIDDALEQNTGY